MPSFTGQAACYHELAGQAPQASDAPGRTMDGHVNDTTPSPAAGDTSNEPQDNWEGRYAGLQKVVAKRDTELTTATAELDRLRKENEQALADLDTYRQRDVDQSEEELARAQYEALRSRFETDPATPVGNNQARPAKGWMDPEDDSPAWDGRERAGDGMGFPTS